MGNHQVDQENYRRRPLRVYVAAPWSRKAEAAEWATRLDEDGFDITSTWHARGDISKTEEESLATEAQEDLIDIVKSDVVVVLGFEMSEGKAFEAGYAHACHIPVVLVRLSNYGALSAFRALVHPVAGYLQLLQWLQAAQEALI